MVENYRASKREIVERFVSLSNEEARELIDTVGQLISTNQFPDILPLVTEFDSRYGGIHFGSYTSRRYDGVYRPLYYAYLPFMNPNTLEYYGREIVSSSGAYLEGMLKVFVRMGFFGRLKHHKLPLGQMLHKGKKQLPEKLYDDLMWFTHKIHNFAKHDYFIDDENPPDHAFEIDEAIAGYLIARILGQKLEKLTGLTQDELEARKIEYGD